MQDLKIFKNLFNVEDKITLVTGGGTGIGKITLYKEKKVVQRNIPSEEAVNALIDLIKTNGDWVAPSS